MTDKIMSFFSLGPNRFLDDAPIAVLLANASATIEWANRAAVTLFGYSRDEFIGKNINMLLPDDVREKHDGHFAGWVQHPKAREMGSGLDIKGRNKNGAVIDLDIQITPIETEQGVMAMAWVQER